MQRRNNPTARDSDESRMSDITFFPEPEELFSQGFDRLTITGALLAAENDNLELSFQMSVLVEKCSKVIRRNRKLKLKNKCLKERLQTAKKDVDNFKSAFEAIDEDKESCVKILDLESFQQHCEKIKGFFQEFTAKDEELVNEIREHTIKNAEAVQYIQKCSSLQESIKKNVIMLEESWEMRLKEEQWLKKQNELMKRASQAEEELRRVMIQNNQLQELVLQTRESTSKEEGAKGGSARLEREDQKEQEKGKKWCFWRKNKQKCNKAEEKEARVCEALAGQEEETNENKKGKQTQRQERG